MEIGHTILMQKRNSEKKGVFNVFQFVNSSLTVFTGTYHPMNKQAKNPTAGRNICPVTKSKRSKRLRPPNVSHSTPVSDREQNTPINNVDTETMVALFLLDTFISSWMNAVLTS